MARAASNVQNAFAHPATLPPELAELRALRASNEQLVAEVAGLRQDLAGRRRGRASTALAAPSLPAEADPSLDALLVELARFEPDGARAGDLLTRGSHAFLVALEEYLGKPCTSTKTLGVALQKIAAETKRIRGVLDANKSPRWRAAKK